MRSSLGLIGFCVCLKVSAAARTFSQTGIHVGKQPYLSTTPGNVFTLDTIGQIATLDYGQEVAGHPYFDVASLDGPVQIEVKYSEQFSGLNHPWGDGPYQWATNLANTFRVETFNLLTQGQISFSSVGLLLSIDIPDVDHLSGHFECSNPAYNEIWKLGARVVSTSCINAGTQSKTWDVTSEGAYIRGQKPALSVVGDSFINYNLTFTSKIVRGGTGWAMAQPIGSNGLQMLLASNLQEDTSFNNTNRTLTPPNSIVLGFGTSLVNQTSIVSYYIDIFDTPFPIVEDEWYSISSTVVESNYVSATVNGKQVFNVSLADYGIELTCFNCASEIPLGTGSWGFGPWQDQIAIVKDVIVTASNGTLLYENDMKSERILQEYGVAENTANVCMDGAKRDRLVWLGDFYHTQQIIASSTARNDYVRGTLEYLINWQLPDGEMGLDAQLGYNADSAIAISSGGTWGLDDYQILGIAGFAEYFQLTNDIETARVLWPGLKRTIGFIINNISNTTYLSQITGFTGVPHGTATSAGSVKALNGAAIVADALNDTSAASTYRNIAAKVTAAVNELLWNPTLGVYSFSTASPSNFSVIDIAFVISSGILSAAIDPTSMNSTTSSTRTTSLLNNLEFLKLKPGYKDASFIYSATAALSPNTNGFLLAALKDLSAVAEAKYLLDNLWAAMISDRKTSTGTTWEYVSQDLTPGSLSTSLSHPWGGAPTYVMTQWIAGIRAVEPGYKVWSILPEVTGFGVSWAKGKVSTAYGTLSVQWSLGKGNQTVEIEVSAPNGTTGSVGIARFENLGNWSVHGRVGSGGNAVKVQ